MIRTMRSRSTLRSTTRAAALGALVIALAAGCGDTSGDDGSPADGDSDPSVSDGGEATGDDASGGDGSAGGDTSEAVGASDAGGADGAPSDGGTAGDGAGDDAAAGGAPLPESADLATEQLPVPVEDAVAIALETAGGGETVSVSIDHDDDRDWVWEIEVALDGREHEIDIDAATGEVLQHEEDDDRVDEPAVDVTSPMTPAEAIDLALRKHDGRVSSWDLDSDDGTIRYQIDLERSGGDDTEIEVDVETGEVRVED